MKTVTKSSEGFLFDCGDEFVKCVYSYDARGVYVGQYQDDMFYGGEVFISADTSMGIPTVNGMPIPPLTGGEMANAI